MDEKERAADPLKACAHDTLKRAADMLLAYAELVKATGRYAEEHYIPEVEWVASELRAPLAAAPAPASVLAYMAANREGEVRFTDNAKEAAELERDGWAITPLSQAPAPLTYEQIEALRCIDDCGEAAPEFSRIVRIAERALGIGTDAAPAPAPETFDDKCARNARVQTRYDELMREGKRGHYEALFRVVREEVERVRGAQTQKGEHQ